MSRIILVTNPADDAPVKYLDAWSELIIETAKKQKLYQPNFFKNQLHFLFRDYHQFPNQFYSSLVCKI